MLSVDSKVAPSKKLTLAIVPSASVALADSVVAPVGKMAFAAGAVKVTTGAVLELKVTLLSVMAPSLSVALARIVCGPVANEGEIEYGLETSVPSNVAPSKKATEVIVPSVSVAATVRLVLPEATTALLAGVCQLRAGNLFTATLFNSTLSRCRNW